MAAPPSKNSSRIRDNRTSTQQAKSRNVQANPGLYPDKAAPRQRTPINVPPVVARARPARKVLNIPPDVARTPRTRRVKPPLTPSQQANKKANPGLYPKG